MTKTTLTNINRRAFCATLWTLVLSTLSITAPMASAKDGKDAETMRSRTPLAGPVIAGQTPKGHAEFRVEPDRGRTKLNVEVEDVNLAAGTMLSVVVDHGNGGMSVGTIKLDAFRSGELELNSEDGDTVPTIAAGDTVTVKNGSIKILVGVF